MAGEEPDAETSVGMADEPGHSGLGETSTSKMEPNPDTLSSQRVFKKSSPNNKLTLYLSSRDLLVTEERIDRLQGVLLVDPEYIDNRKVYGQVTLTFRYGREDEEVMGLKFCNEAVMCLAQLYPPHPSSTLAQQHLGNTPLQDALMKRLGPNAYPFTMEITPLAPPSVQLVPAKEYNGAPIGTSYDVRAYIADRPDEKLQRKTTVRMGIRVVQRAGAPPPPLLAGAADGKPRAQHHVSRITTLFGRGGGGGGNGGGCDGGGSGAGTRSSRADIGRTAAAMFGHHQRDHAAPSTETTSLPASGTGSTSNSPKVAAPALVNGVEGGADSAHSTPARRAPDQICSDNESSQMEHIGTECCAAAAAAAARRASALLREVPAPRAAVDKPFLLSEGRIALEASLDRAIYSHGEPVRVHVAVQNNSSRTVRRIKVFVVQHVDVCMFSNGKFKNVVAIINCKEDCPVSPGMTLNKVYSLAPTKGSTKNWIALEDSYSKSGTSLASTVTCNSNSPEDRNVFAIYVSYYVKVKLLVSVMGGELSLKLPFTLMHTCPEYEPQDTLTRCQLEPPVQLELAPAEEEPKPEKDGT